MIKTKEQIYGRNDMVMLDKHNKIYGSLGIAEQYVFNTAEGNPVILRYPKKGKLKDVATEFEMQGWTEQDSTTGAQLINQDETVIGGLVGSTGNEFSSTDRIRIGLIRVEPNTTYIISGLSGFNIANSFAYDSEKTIVRLGTVTTTTTTTLENEYYLRMSFSKPDQSDFTEEELQKLRKMLMFNKGVTALPYEPYTGGVPSPNPDYPQEIVSAGKYNEDMQKWEYEITIANEQTDPDKNQTVTLTSDRPLTKWDKLTKKDGVWGWEYKSAEIVLDGSEKWLLYPQIVGIVFYIYLPNTSLGFQTSLCDKYRNINRIWEVGYDEVFGIYSDHDNTLYKYFRPPSVAVETVEQWQAWLSENPLTLWYETAEETFIPLTASEQEQMNALHTNRPTTVLSNDVKANMKITYKATQIIT